MPLMEYCSALTTAQGTHFGHCLLMLHILKFEPAINSETLLYHHLLIYCKNRYI